MAKHVIKNVHSKLDNFIGILPIEISQYNLWVSLMKAVFEYVIPRILFDHLIEQFLNLSRDLPYKS